MQSLLIKTYIFSFQIERWWKELHERMEKFFKEHLALLKDHGHYDPFDETDRFAITISYQKITKPCVTYQGRIFREREMKLS